MLSLLGFLALLAGCGESEAPVKQQAYQQIPRLSAEDEDLIFGNATHVDIYEQLSIGATDSLDSSDDPPTEEPAAAADLFFGEARTEGDQQTPLFGDPAPISDAPALGQSDSIFGEDNSPGETPLTEIKPLDDPSGDTTAPENTPEPDSLDKKP